MCSSDLVFKFFPITLSIGFSGDLDITGRLFCPTTSQHVARPLANAHQLQVLKSSGALTCLMVSRCTYMQLCGLILVRFLDFYAISDVIWHWWDLDFHTSSSSATILLSLTSNNKLLHTFTFPSLKVPFYVFCLDHCKPFFRQFFGEIQGVHSLPHSETFAYLECICPIVL